MISSILNAKMLIALSLCLTFLLTAGAWVPLMADTGENTATDTDPPWEVGARGTRGDPILIRNVWDLQNMSKDLTAEYALANDINASATKEWNSGAGFEPIGDNDNRFTGSLDGRNFTISGLYIKRSSTNYVGLFGAIGSGGSVSNVGLADVDVTGKYNVGGLVGRNQEGSVVNCYATGSVSGDYMVGGLVGENGEESSVVNCYATSSVSGTDVWGPVGGLVGWNHGSVSNCYATGDVSSSGDTVGGLVGYNSGSVSNCYATGGVTGDEDVGGLVGMAYGSVSKCYATGSVSGTEAVGGLVGSHAGSGASVSKCYATGSVSGEVYVGGLVGYIGYLGSVSNCYATGSVTRSSGTETDFGGFVGGNYRARINKCYSTGPVRWQSAPHPTDKGFCGSVDTRSGYQMSGNFWDMETSGQNSTAGDATGENTAEMKSRNTFTDTGWDFSETWIIIEHTTYPLLKWQDAEPPTANAGPDQTVEVYTTVTFNGSTSTDDLAIRGYKWTFNDGTGDVTLHGVCPEHTFTIEGGFVVTLNVTDYIDNWHEDTVNITVNPDTTPPSAHAGPDQTVDEGGTVTFDGSASTDNVGIVNYTWTFNDGSGNVTLYGIAPNHTFVKPGVYTVTLNVTDIAGYWNTDTMIATVCDITPPTALIGPDQTVDEGATVIFDGSTSTDNVGIVNYTWTFNDSTGNVTLYGVALNYTFVKPGVYTVTLNVTDEAGYWDTDTMIVIVDSTPPTTNAGADQTVNEGTTVILDGSASTDNAGIVNFTWTFHDGTDEITLYGIGPNHTFRRPGVYTITLNVTDAVGLWDTDTLTLTVRDITPPVARAGPDQTVDEGATVTFDGSASTDNVGIEIFKWTLDNGIQNITLYRSNPVVMFPVPGVYTVTLTVTDAAGNWHTDTMTVTVLGEPSFLLIHQPRWQTGDSWTWLVTAMVDGEPYTHRISETVVRANVTSTDNGTALPEPCFEIEAAIISGGVSTVAVRVWLSMESLHILALRVFDGNGGDGNGDNGGGTGNGGSTGDGGDDEGDPEGILSHFLFGFMSEFRWPLAITSGGTHRWSDAGRVEVGEGTYHCFMFEGEGSVSLYYSPEVRHFVKVRYDVQPPSDFMMYELIPDGPGSDGGDRERGDDDPDSPLDLLFRNLGPLPVIGYLGVILLLVLLTVAGIGKAGKKPAGQGTETNAGPSMPAPPVSGTITPDSLTRTTGPSSAELTGHSGPPPWQPSPVSPAGHPSAELPGTSGPPPWQPSPASPDSQPPSSAFPPPQAPVHPPGVWFCPKCGKQLDGGFMFCIACGFRKGG